MTIDAGLSANLASFQPNWDQGFKKDQFAVLACPAWMLGYISSEIHKSYSPLFSKTTPEETANERREYLKKRYAYLEGVLATKQYLVDNKFSAADAYLYTVTRWAPFVKVDLTGFPNLKEFQARVAARPKVQEAMEAEGLTKKAA